MLGAMETADDDDRWREGPAASGGALLSGPALP